MESGKDQPYKDKCEFYKDLPLEEVLKYFEGIQSKAQAVFERATESDVLTEADEAVLADCMGELMPMVHNQAVQHEAVDKAREYTNLADFAFYKITELQHRILLFLSTFENSGVQRIENDTDSFS